MDRMDIHPTDWDRLTPEAQATVAMLVGLREGRTLNEFTEKLTDAVNGVLDHVTVSESGRISGPKGSVTLVLEVGPNEADPNSFVTLSEKMTTKKPEDRSHAMYVGKGGTVHTRNPMGLFEVKRTADGSVSYTHHEDEADERDDRG